MKMINLNDVCVFDVETTGLDSMTDEVLQLSIIDGTGKVLFSSYIKPECHTAWPAAQVIHGISPEDVADAPNWKEVADQVRVIFDMHKLHVAYNGNFDKRFLERWGCKFNAAYFDVMFHFAPIAGEWDSHHDTYRWQKLIKCAAYYGYEFKAHDALEDVKATLHCFKSMCDADEKLEKELCDRMNGVPELRDLAIKAYVIHRKAVEVWTEGYIESFWTDDNGRLCVAYESGNWWHYKNLDTVPEWW